MINNVGLVSGVKQNDSVVHIYATILFQIIFPLMSLQNTEQSALCYPGQSIFKGEVKDGCPRVCDQLT